MHVIVYCYFTDWIIYSSMHVVRAVTVLINTVRFLREENKCTVEYSRNKTIFKARVSLVYTDRELASAAGFDQCVEAS